MGKQLKEKYNTILIKHTKAEKYINNTDIDIETRKKWEPAFMSIVENGNKILNELWDIGIIATKDEILNGFKLD
jgi:hypothetical protein